MQTTRTEVRKAFKAIGYSVSFKRNPFKDTVCNIAFKTAEMINPIVANGSTCYSAETFESHKKAFALANDFKGFVMTDTDQKIV